MLAKRSNTLSVCNARLAKIAWPTISQPALQNLRALSRELSLSLAAGDLIYLEHGWYVTHTGLLRIARRKHCAGIDARPLARFSDAAASHWAFKATVYKSKTCRGFVGYGDADPSNVSPQVRGAEMRVAETRAVNRALRKAYGIGICSVEEIGSRPLPPYASAQVMQMPAKSKVIDSNGAHPLRDRLCLLIRKQGLNANLVKHYAADFCGTAELRQASREQIREFVTHLAQYAEHDRDGLLCRLNSYAPKRPAAVTSEGNQNEKKVAGAA